MADVRLRPMFPADVEEVVGLLSRHDEDAAEEARAFFRTHTEAAFGDGRHFVLQLGAKIAAVGGSVPDDEPDAHEIRWLYVDPYCQGRGFGTKVLRCVEDDVATRGGVRLYVRLPGRSDDEETAAFFRAGGYAPAATTDAGARRRLVKTIDE